MIFAIVSATICASMLEHLWILTDSQHRTFRQPFSITKYNFRNAAVNIFQQGVLLESYWAIVADVGALLVSFGTLQAAFCCHFTL